MFNNLWCMNVHVLYIKDFGHSHMKGNSALCMDSWTLSSILAPFIDFFFFSLILWKFSKLEVGFGCHYTTVNTAASCSFCTTL